MQMHVYTDQGFGGRRFVADCNPCATCSCCVLLVTAATVSLQDNAFDFPGTFSPSVDRARGIVLGVGPSDRSGHAELDTL